MKKSIMMIFLFAAMGAAGCTAKIDTKDEVPQNTNIPTVEINDDLLVTNDKKDSTDDSGKDTSVSENTDVTVEDITDEQALSAVRNYCIKNNPGLEEMADSEDYTLYWEVVSSTEEQIVVLYRAYTGAQIRYYIDTKTGDTYVTEFVPGITDEEEKTEESFNVKDYMDGNVSSSKDFQIPEGMWQTASIEYEEDGDIQPSYYVEFADSYINYGHLKGGEFVLDHSDNIVSAEKNSSDGYVVKAETSEGLRYTYAASEEDKDILEYYETWNDDKFAERYIGGKSLGRVIDTP